MTDYKAIVGKGIKVVSTNIDNAEGEGQIWFNSTTGEFKDVLNVSAWSTSAPTNISRGSGYGFGTLTAGVTGLGEAGPPGLVPAATEEYNGSGWSTGNNYPRQDYLINACGTQTAGLASGGFGPPASDESNHYNGTSWTAGGDMGEGRFGGGMFGIQTAAIYCGGDNPSPGYSVNTELYNGSSWSEVNNLPADKRQFATAGTSTAGLACGGRLGPGPSTATVEEWDGTNWTAAPSLNTARRYLQGWGIQTSALVCGGSPNGTPASTLTEVYDGTSWSETGDLATGRHLSGTSQNQGSNTSGWFANGNAGPTFYANTEEFSSSVNVITNSVWSSGGNANVVREVSVMAGPETAAVVAAGFDASSGPFSVGNVEYYNGSSWSEQTDVGTARGGQAGGGTGQSSFLIFGGATDAGPATPNRVGNTEEWNGSSWTESGDLSTARFGLAGCGTEPAALACGGSDGTRLNNTEEYGGSSWTSGGNYITSNSGLTMVGTQTAALAFAGSTPSQVATNATYNGSAWTTAPYSLVVAGSGIGATGTSTAAFGFGGYLPSKSSISQRFNGSAWSIDANLGTARGTLAGTGPTTASLAAFGVAGPGKTNATEEYTEGTSALNVVTVSTS